jgi:hypothetical protein
MAMIIRVQELVTRRYPENEYPTPVMQTKYIYKVPDDFDYGAMCDDCSNVEVIAEHVPDDAKMGTWELPIPKLVLKGILPPIRNRGHAEAGALALCS